MYTFSALLVNCGDTRTFDVPGPSHEPRITFIDLELGRENKIATDFSIYLTLLRLNLGDNSFGLSDDRPLPEIASVIGKSMKCMIEDMGTEDYGYPVFRGNLGTGNDPQWIWISPNRVPRGFVRQRDPQFRKLSALLTGTILRYPEFDTATYIVTSTDKVVDRIDDACQQTSIQQLKLMPFNFS